MTKGTRYILGALLSDLSFRYYRKNIFASLDSGKDNIEVFTLEEAYAEIEKFKRRNKQLVKLIFIFKVESVMESPTKIRRKVTDIIKS